MRIWASLCARFGGLSHPPPRLGGPGWGQSDHTACCFCRGSGNSSWEIPRASKAEEGTYQCIAVSRAGTGQADAQIVITGLSFSVCSPRSFPSAGVSFRSLSISGAEYWPAGTWGQSLSQSVPIRVTTYTLTPPGPCRGRLPSLMSVTCLVFFQGDLLPAVMSPLSPRTPGMP